MPLKTYFKKNLLALFSYLPGNVKIATYRALGATIGDEVELGSGSFILPFDGDFRKIRIGNEVIIDDHVRIMAKYLSLGDYTQIRDRTRIWGESAFSMGTGSYLDRACNLDLRRDIVFGDEVVVSGGSWFYTHAVFQSALAGAPFSMGAIRVEDRAYLGANVFVLPGIVIGHDTMVGARSVVTRDVSPDTVVLGNPARSAGKVSDRRKQLGPDEKDRLVREILDRFVSVYDRNAVQLANTGNEGYSLRYGRTIVYYHPRIHSVEMLESIGKTGRPSLILSFDIPEDVRKYCTVHGIGWLDLGTSGRSEKPSDVSRTIERSFGNYGVRFFS